MLSWTRRTAIVALLSSVVALPAMGQGMQGMQMKGPASPPDITWAQLGNACGSEAKPTDNCAHILIAYSRPFKRGRTIFGGLVPYDQVWRTGANPATTIVTDKEVDIGGTTVPAGTYTLYTLPSASGWKLIVNKQVGQWGTVYNQDQDLARIPMKVSTVSTSVEEFTISITRDGVLKLTWDTTEASVPITLK